MDAEFHRDSAKIYSFVSTPRRAEGERVEPRMRSADIVPLRCVVPREPAPAASGVTYADFGSGWYHGAAIDGTDPLKH